MCELIVACRRPPPAPAGGWGPRSIEGAEVQVAPLERWTALVAEHLEGELALVLAFDLAEEQPAVSVWSLCCALADAGDGVVLERMPVTFPPRYGLRHRGEPVALTWAELVPYVERRAREARERQERERREAREAFEKIAAEDPEGVGRINEPADS